MEDLKESKMEEMPGFYKNPAGGDGYIKKTTVGNFGSKLERLVKIVRHKVPSLAQDDLIKINHNLGAIHQYYGRYKPKSADKWQMFPTIIPTTTGFLEQVRIDSIDKRDITIAFNTVPLDEEYEFQIFFSEFKVD